MFRRPASLLVLALTPLALAACGEVVDPDPTPGPGLAEELPVGDIDGLDEMKADGAWGFATECKPIPDLPALNDPAIVISLDGLTLHLYDRAGTYDRVFPVGVGVIENGHSLTPVSTGRSDGLFYARADLPQVADGPTPADQRWGYNYRCKVWWRSADTGGELLPVFAGLPFLRLEGPPSTGYGIHGPIDRFTRQDGGMLRRGYVSHGCVRMEAADLVEVFARIQGHRVPVRIQQPIERRADDRAVDVAPSSRWIMSECQSDADCSFDGGFCHRNPYSGRGFCTESCSRYCPDQYGQPTTFCVPDPDGAAGTGMCVSQSSGFNADCRRYDHFVPQYLSRNGQASVKRTVCAPGTEGWIGDRCLANGDCMNGQCSTVDAGPAGVCTELCSRYCPDLDGHAGTFCIDDPDNPGARDGLCAARCDTNDDCALGTTCEGSPRHSQPSVVRGACVPY